MCVWACHCTCVDLRSSGLAARALTCWASHQPGAKCWPKEAVGLEWSVFFSFSFLFFSFLFSSFLFFFFPELGIEPRTLHLLGKHSTTEPNPQHLQVPFLEGRKGWCFQGGHVYQMLGKDHRVRRASGGSPSAAHTLYAKHCSKCFAKFEAIQFPPVTCRAFE